MKLFGPIALKCVCRGGRLLKNYLLWKKVYLDISSRVSFNKFYVLRKFIHFKSKFKFICKNLAKLSIIICLFYLLISPLKFLYCASELPHLHFFLHKFHGLSYLFLKKKKPQQHYFGFISYTVFQFSTQLISALKKDPPGHLGESVS